MEVSWIGKFRDRQMLQLHTGNFATNRLHSLNTLSLPSGNKNYKLLGYNYLLFGYNFLVSSYFVEYL